jgi:hypothetical protein
MIAKSPSRNPESGVESENLAPVVDEPVRTRGIEAMNSTAQRLAVHAADFGRRTAIHQVADRRQRQKPPAPIDIL